MLRLCGRLIGILWYIKCHYLNKLTIKSCTGFNPPETIHQLKREYSTHHNDTTLTLVIQQLLFEQETLQSCSVLVRSRNGFESTSIS